MLFLINMMKFFYYSLGLLVIFYATFIIRKWSYLKFSANNNAFYVPFLPVIGTMYLFLLGRCHDNVVKAVEYMGKTFGFPFNIWHGHDYYYYTSDPTEAKILLTKTEALNKGTVYNDIAYVFHSSLLTIEHSKWKARRRQYAKCFRPSSIKQFALTYNDSSNSLKEHIKELNRDSKQSSYDTFTKYAFNTFFNTSVGLEEKPKNMHRFGECLMEFQVDVAKKMLDPITPPAIWIRFYRGGKNTAKNMREIKGICKEILRNKIKQRSNYKDFIEHEENPILLDLMMSLRGTLLSDEEIYNDIIFFSAAAADTSGHCLMITFTLAGMFPECQEKIYQEVCDVIKHDQILQEDLINLVYTEAFISESLRLFPVIPILSRQLTDDINLGTKIVPKGSNIGVSIFNLHRNEKYWTNPLNFDPSRFLPENLKNIQPYTYIPFSTGPRDCLGKAQAMAMLKITLADTIRSFKISSTHKSIDEFQIMSSLSLKTCHPLDCQFKLRV